MTFIGILTFFLAIIGSFVSWPWLIAMLMFMLNFNNATVYFLGANLLKPFYVILAVAWFRLAVGSVLGSGDAGRVRGNNEIWVLFVGCYAVLCSILCPVLFEGAYTLLPREGVDDQVAAMSQLYLGVINYGQAAYWVIHLAFVIAVLVTSVNIRDGDWVWGVTAGSIAFISLSVWEILADAANVYFPYELFNHSGVGFFGLQSWGGLTRLQSTFMEPSGLGAYMTPVCAFFTLRFQREKKLWLAVCAAMAALVLARSLSTTAFIGLVIIYLISFLGVFTAWTNSRRSVSYFPYFVIFILFTLVLSGLYWMGWIDGLVLEKLDSSSGKNRTAADLIALSVFIESWGLGFGFGSFRSSSLLSSVLASGGVIVFGAMLALVWKAFRDFLQPRDNYAVWLFAGTLLSSLLVAFVSAPDANSSIIWFLMGGYFYVSRVPKSSIHGVRKHVIRSRACLK